MRHSLQLLVLALPVLTAACGGGMSRVANVSAAAADGTPPEAAPSAEKFTSYGVNPMVEAKVDHLSTFAVDVDTASYSIARRYLMQQEAVPPAAAVRVEEFVNSFGYDYPKPTKGPFAVDVAGAPSPFEPGHTLVRVALQGRTVGAQERKPVHLVYLVDTSGSMSSPDKMGLAKESLRLLTETLHPGDTVALCTYAGSVREVLAPTGIDGKSRILKAIDDLEAGGSTAMSSGIELAYRLASKTHLPGHVSRVVVLSDGDANVGNTSHVEILKTIAQYKQQGITLSTVGFGSGNYQDTMMEQLADRGDGNYSYVDSAAEAHRVFAGSVDGLLQVIARDVKVQVDFDPTVVERYRLIGYENRNVADQDFRSDKVDGGEVGAGHSVTALYDVVLQPNAGATSLLTVHVRAKEPLAGEQAVETTYPMDPKALAKSFEQAPASFRFAAAAAGFAEILRHSPGVTYRFGTVEAMAQAALEGKQDRVAFVELVRKAARLTGEKPVAVAAR